MIEFIHNVDSRHGPNIIPNVVPKIILLGLRGKVFPMKFGTHYLYVLCSNYRVNVFSNTFFVNC